MLFIYNPYIVKQIHKLYTTSNTVLRYMTLHKRISIRLVPNHQFSNLIAMNFGRNEQRQYPCFHSIDLSHTIISSFILQLHFLLFPLSLSLPHHRAYWLNSIECDRVQFPAMDLLEGNGQGNRITIFYFLPISFSYSL